MTCQPVKPILKGVMIFDIMGGYLDVFGTQNELEEYVEKVGKPGDYPVLAELMELYVMEESRSLNRSLRSVRGCWPVLMPMLS